MTKVAEVFVEISAKMQKLESGLRRSQRLVARSAGKMRSAMAGAFKALPGIVGKALSLTFNIFKAFARRITKAAKRIGLVIAAALGAATFVGLRFEKRMARVRALTASTELEFAHLEKTAKTLGRTTVFSASQVAEAMGEFALAGFRATDIIESMPAVLNMAAAAELEVGEAANIAARVMGGMGLSAKELANAVDVMTKAFTSSLQLLPELGQALRFVGPSAREAGKELEEVVAVLQALAQGGRAGTEAGSGLRRVFAQLQTEKTAEAFKELGITLDDGAGKLKNIADIIEDVNNAFANATAIEKSAFAFAQFGLRGGPTFQILMGQGADAIRDFEKALKDARGTAKTLAAVMLDRVGGSLTILRSALEGLGIAVFEVFDQDMRRGAERATKWVQRLTMAFETAGPRIRALFLDLVKAGWDAITGAIKRAMKALDDFTEFSSLQGDLWQRFSTGAEIAFTKMAAMFKSKMLEAVEFIFFKMVDIFPATFGNTAAIKQFGFKAAATTGGDALRKRFREDFEFQRGFIASKLKSDLMAIKLQNKMEKQVSRIWTLWQRILALFRAVGAPLAPLPGTPPALKPKPSSGDRTPAQAIARALITSVQTAIGGFRIGQKNRSEQFLKKIEVNTAKSARALEAFNQAVSFGGGVLT